MPVLAIILWATLPAMAQLKFTVTTDPYYVIPDQLLGTNSPPYPDFLTPAPPSVFCEKANSIHPCANPETIFCPFGCNCAGTFRTGIPQTFKDATSVLGFKSVYFPYGTISRYYHYVPGGNGYCMNEDESYLITEWGFVKQPSDSMPAKSFCNEVNFKYGNFFDVNTALCRNDANPERSMHTVISANTYFGNWQELELMLEHCASQGVIVDAIVFGTEIRNDQDNSPITIVPDGDTIPYPSGTKYFNRVQRLYIDSLKSDPRYASLPLYFSIAARSKDQGGCVARTYSCEDSTGGNSIWNIELHNAIESYNATHPLPLRFAGAVNWWWYPVDTTKGILTSQSAINDMNDFFDMGLSSAGNALCYKYPGGFAEGSFTGFDEILVDQWGIKRYEICNVPYQNTFLNQVFILKRALNMFDNNYNRINNPENSNGITVTHAFYDRLAKNDTYCPLDQVLGTDTWDTLNTSYYGLKQMNRFAGHKFKRAGFTGATEQNLDAYFLFNCDDAKLVILNYSGTPYTIKKITVDTMEYKGSAKLDYEITSVSNTSTKGTLAGLEEISEEISYNNKKLTSIIIPGYSIITVHLTVIPQAGAAETCNGVDDDCDGLTDENAKQIFYPDLDGDGYGDPGFHVESCSAPDGFVSDNTDCL
jgi:hypothetical protein